LEGLDPDIPKILVTHQPPYGTKADSTWTGKHVGSHAIREFIELEQPLICFTGHIHEAVSIDTIGKTKIINSGMISGSNRYAYTEIVGGQVSTLKLERAHPYN
ncbi:MAG: hypothetical protein AAFV93_15240, partial [Chloroflexota bacterium]